jgi:hypothetical protein
VDAKGVGGAALDGTLATVVIGAVDGAPGVGPGNGINDGLGTEMIDGMFACAWVASKIGVAF